MRFLLTATIVLFALTLQAQQKQPPKKEEQQKQKRQPTKQEQLWWHSNYEEARQKAIKQNKILVLLYGGLGDGWTERLMKELEKEKLGDAAGKVVCCFVKEDSFSVVSRFRVMRRDVPTLLFLWPLEQRVFGRLTRPAHFRQALKILQRALKQQQQAHKLLASAKPEDLIKLARIFLECYEFAEAERALRRTISLAKDDKDAQLQARVLLLSVYIERNEPYRISVELEKIKKLDPDNKKFAAERMFAKAYMEQFVTRKRDEAEKLWRKLLKEHPKFRRIDEVKLYLGLVLYAKSDFEGAKSLWDEVAKGSGEVAYRAKAFLKLMSVAAPKKTEQKEEKGKEQK